MLPNPRPLLEMSRRIMGFGGEYIRPRDRRERVNLVEFREFEALCLSTPLRDLEQGSKLL